MLEQARGATPAWRVAVSDGARARDDRRPKHLAAWLVPIPAYRF